jgi:hypothetical protein
VFAIGGDDQAYVGYSDRNSYLLVAPGQVKDLTYSFATEAVFAIGGDNQVYVSYFIPNFDVFQAYSLTTPGQVKQVAVGQDAARGLHLFALGGDNQLYESDLRGSAYTPYALTSPGQVKKVAVGYDDAGRMHLFAVGGDDQAYEMDFDANGLPVVNPGHTAYYLTSPGRVKDLGVGYGGPGDAGGQPSTGHGPGGALVLFVVGGDDQVYQQSFDAAGHNGYYAFGGSSYVFTTAGWVKPAGYHPYPGYLPDPDFLPFPDFL